MTRDEFLQMAASVLTDEQHRELTDDVKSLSDEEFLQCMVKFEKLKERHGNMRDGDTFESEVNVALKKCNCGLNAKLTRVVNKGGVPYSIITCSRGMEHYSCERKGEAKMVDYWNGFGYED